MAASLHIRDGGNVSRTITDLYIRDANNVSRRIRELYIRDGTNTSRLVFSSAALLTASAAPESLYGSTLGTGTATTDATTVTPSGGTGPYTYAWTVVSYDNPSAAPTATAPAAATSAFTQTSIGIAEAYNATWRCTVTDSAVPANTATVDVAAFWVDTT